MPSASIFPGNAQDAGLLIGEPKVVSRGDRNRFRYSDQGKVGSLERHLGGVSPEIDGTRSLPSYSQSDRIIEALACSQSEFTDAIGLKSV